MFVWMLSLIQLYVKEDGWDGFCQGALKWDWSQVAVRDGWEIPAPEWARQREEEDIRNGLVETVVMNGEEDSVKKVVDVETDKEVGKEENDDEIVGVGKEGDGEGGDGGRGGGKEEDGEREDREEGEEKEGEKCVKEEGVKGKYEDDCVKIKVGTWVHKVEMLEMEEAGEAAFPCSSWGLQLPPATPPNTKSLFAWRPWEVAKPGRWKKRRSPASQARSLYRLRKWQEQRDIQRGTDQFTMCPSTPLPPPREMSKTRLLDRMDSEVGGKSGSQNSPLTQWSGSQIPLDSPCLSGSQTIPCFPSGSGSQTVSCSPPWSGSQTRVERFVSRYIAKAIFCIVWKHQKISRY